MHELSRYLFLAAGLPFVFLGSAHAWATPVAVGARRGLSPRDPKLAETMAAGTMLLTRRTDLWRAWVGFNYSHSLGVVLFGVLLLLMGRSEAVFAREAPVFLPLGLVVAACYLVLAVKFWFRTPVLGCAVSLALLVASWLLF